LPALQEIFSENKKSALVFAHGMSNSGKTHTIIGNLVAFLVSVLGAFLSCFLVAFFDCFF